MALGRLRMLIIVMHATIGSSTSQAGTIIAQEAGGIVNTTDLTVCGGVVTGDCSDKVLTGRKYIVMRYVNELR